MKISILELDQIREQTKVILLKEILGWYTKGFWNSTGSMEMLESELESLLCDATQESERLERILSIDSAQT